MDPKVSIIIPFYNCPYIDQAIQSAINQTYENKEIIVVDDGSTVFKEKISPFFSKISYLQKKKNGGTATALNVGINKAQGDYISWLSSDDYFLYEKTAQQMKFMLNKNVGSSFTNYDYIDENNNVIVSCNGPRFSNTGDVYREFMKYNAINGCTTIIKKSLFEKIGFFNPSLRYTHDYDMWFRLLLSNQEPLYIDKVLVKFRYHTNSGTNKYTKKIIQEAHKVESYYRPILRSYIDRYL